MTEFSDDDMQALDAIWRQLPMNHAWTGWARIDSYAGEIWLFRTRANWRRFILRKSGDGMVLEDDTGKAAQSVAGMADLPAAVARVPALVGEPN